MEFLERSRILIVDDDPAVRATLTEAFRDAAHETEAVESGERALSALRERPFDVVIVDKSLPGINGVELIRRIHYHHADVWSAMITGYPTTESATELLHLGVRCYLEKPFEDIASVVERIDRMLEMRRSQLLLQGAMTRLRSAIRTLSHSQALRILVVASSTEERMWLARSSGDEHDVVHAVAGLKEALDDARAISPDLIVFDVPLPRAGLMTFVREARAVAPLASLVVVCDSPSMPLLVELIEARVAALIEHPLVEVAYRARLDPVLQRLRRARTSAAAGVACQQ